MFHAPAHAELAGRTLRAHGGVFLTCINITSAGNDPNILSALSFIKKINTVKILTSRQVMHPEYFTRRLFSR